MDLVALQIFKTVAEAGGITKAAARLHRVQSNITTRVKQLEERLGTTLFHRHKRRLVLSPEGRTLLAYADRLLALSSEAQAALRDGAPRGLSAHRLAREHGGDAPAAGAFALSPRLSARCASSW